MRDIRFISIADAIEIQDYYEIEDSSPRVVKITASQGMGYANRVYVNGLGTETFTILSNTALLVTLPDDAQSVALDELEFSVSSSRLTSRKGRTTLSFGTTKNISSVSGIQKLIQQVVKDLLSDISSNRFSLSDGGGLLASLGSVSFTPSAANKIAASIQASISNTQTSIQNNQVGQKLPAEERLLSLEVSSIDFNESTGTASAGIRLVSYAGVDFTIPLAL
jgi:hypothetical protein